MSTLYLNFKKENRTTTRRSQAQISLVLLFTSEGDLYLVSESLGH